MELKLCRNCIHGEPVATNKWVPNMNPIQFWCKNPRVMQHDPQILGGLRYAADAVGERIDGKACGRDGKLYDPMTNSQRSRKAARVSGGRKILENRVKWVKWGAK